MAHGPAPLQKVLKTSGTVRDLLERARGLHLLLGQVRRHLPPPVDSHCSAAVLRDRRLLLFVDSPAWASRVRYLSAGLTARLRQDGLTLDRVAVRVAVVRPPQPPRKKASRTLPPDSARLIRQIADEIGDEALAAALRRLGSHG